MLHQHHSHVGVVTGVVVGELFDAVSLGQNVQALTELRIHSDTRRQKIDPKHEQSKRSPRTIAGTSCFLFLQHCCTQKRVWPRVT